MENEKVLIDRYAASLKSAEILISREKLRAFASRAELLLPKVQELLNEVNDIISKNPDEIKDFKKLKRKKASSKSTLLHVILVVVYLLILLFSFFYRLDFWLITIISILFSALGSIISFMVTKNGKSIIKDINSLIEAANRIINELLREGIYIPTIAPVEMMGDDFASLRSALISGRNRLLLIIGFLQALKKYKEGK
jgi:uncharacterized membrane protein (DUF485 family)